MKKVKVLIGNYGSGKSELALNFAMQAAARGEKTGSPLLGAGSRDWVLPPSPRLCPLGHRP